MTDEIDIMDWRHIDINKSEDDCFSSKQMARSRLEMFLMDSKHEWEVEYFEKLADRFNYDDFFSLENGETRSQFNQLLSHDVSFDAISMQQLLQHGTFEEMQPCIDPKNLCPLYKQRSLQVSSSAKIGKKSSKKRSSRKVAASLEIQASLGSPASLESLESQNSPTDDDESASSQVVESAEEGGSSSSQKCEHCHTSNTSLWRRQINGQVQCNACALYFRLHRVPRPLHLATGIVKTRRRGSVEHRPTVSQKRSCK